MQQQQPTKWCWKWWKSVQALAKIKKTNTHTISVGIAMPWTIFCIEARLGKVPVPILQWDVTATKKDWRLTKSRACNSGTSGFTEKTNAWNDAELSGLAMHLCWRVWGDGPKEVGGKGQSEQRKDMDTSFDFGDWHLAAKGRKHSGHGRCACVNLGALIKMKLSSCKIAMVFKLPSHHSNKW